MEYPRYLVAVTLLFLVWSCTAFASEEAGASPWYQRNGAQQWQLNLYFYWSTTCPHCQKAKPVVERMARDIPWLQLLSKEVGRNRENRAEYMAMARRLGQEARSVPAFIFCGKMLVGFDNEAGMGRQIRAELEQCHQQLLNGQPPKEAVVGKGARIPLFGYFDVSQHSLPLITLVIAALDAFNPCAFFVLLFLLSLLIHTRNRRRMLFIGGVFIFFSGAIYFLFMAAWLNLFLFMGMQRLFTVVAGLVAIALALINIKDFFLPAKGPSLSIADEKKPGLFRRIRGLLQADNLPALTVGTITLAIAANSYELLCTSGLPMVYTRILTLEALPSSSYYLYLLLYNVIYVVPLLLILLLFTYTLGQRKLQPDEGRLLKLLSGIMMIELGLALLFAPALLGSVKVIAAAMFGALLMTAAAWYGLRIQRKGQ